ncbi:MAG: hypothetical protein KDD08_04330 [Mangrovimonas sp.]|nr:hypothetical protein [Mangrovimonas sp.]
MTNRNKFRIMKTRTTLAVLVAFLGLTTSISHAQNEECMTKLSIFHEYVKAENFDAAYEPWMWFRQNCKGFNRAVIVDGEKILKYKIEKTSGTEQVAFINDLIKLYGEGATDYPDKYGKGDTEMDIISTKYKYRTELGLSDEQLYNGYDNVFKNYRKDFTSPSALYTYFSLVVDLFDAGKKPAQDLFDKYDDVMEKIDEEVKNAAEELNKFVEKEDAGQTLTKKESSRKEYLEKILDAFDKVTGSINTKLGQRANCEVLIPLYKKDFEAKKNDAVWLKRAVSRMADKDCTDDPLFIDLVKAYDQTSPSADTKYYVAMLLLKQGKTNEALGYFRQSSDLETDSYKKGKLAEKIGHILKNKGRYAEARNYYMESIKLNPSNGRPYLAIGTMYANSANDCGDSVFNKRAVYWLAAAEADKAAKVDPTIRSHAQQSAESWRAKAPSKSDIFTQGNAGQTISVGCWINRSVTVPSI